MQVAERIARELGKGWVLVYTRQLRKMIQGFADPGTNPREDKVVHELAQVCARTLIESGFDVVITGVFGYDKYYRFIESMQGLDVAMMSYRIFGEIPSPTSDLLLLRKFHDQVTNGFDITTVNLGVVKEEEMQVCIGETVDFVIADLKERGLDLG